MNKREFKSLLRGTAIIYNGPTTGERTAGKTYIITAIDKDSIGFFKHLNDHNVAYEGHFDQYSLQYPLPVKTMEKSIPEVSLAVPSIPDVPLTPFIAVTPSEPNHREVLKEAQAMSTQILNIALTQGQKLANDMISSVESRLDAIARKTNEVLKVSINDSAPSNLKHQAFPFLKRMIISAKLNKNIMLIGPAGCGKTTAAEQLAEALNIPFHNLTFTAGASETWLFGRQTPNGFVPGSFWLAYKDGGLFLADEFDAGDANLVLSINTAIENGHCFNPINGESVKRHPNFVFIAACNTYGKGGDATYTGRNRLDAASLRRFAGSTIQVEYNLDIERAVCPNESLRTALQSVRAKLLESGSTEVISTGCLKNAYDLTSNGVSLKEVTDSLCVSWPDDLKKLMRNAIKTEDKEKNDIPF